MSLPALLAITEAEVTAHARAYTRAFDPERLALYGAGNIGKMVLGVLEAYGIKPRVVYDDTPSKIGTLFHGIPIRPSSERDPALTVLVTILNPRHHYPDTARRLGGNVLPFLALPWCLPDLELLHITSPAQLLAAGERIARLDALLADALSRETLAAQIAFRMKLDFDALACVPDPYFPQDVPLPLAPGLAYLDAGAFDGDTVRAFLERVPAPGEIIAAEPDPRSFAKLSAWAATRPERIVCRNVAVGAERGTLCFNATGDMSASFDAHGEIEVPVLGLDELWPNGRSAYLKFDIEGAESAALHGAREALATRRPTLAVSVYHRATDLWELPLFLAELGYQLYLRDHGIEGADVVAYAIPR
jgi:FkbM family methyltransferase